MNSSLTRNEQVLTLAAGAKLPLNVGGDYLYFHTVPAGVLASINGGNPSAYVQGELHQGKPGEREVQTVFFDNQSGGTAAVRIVFGMGNMTVAGVATLSGSIPLPTGAATADNQATANGYLSYLVSQNLRTPVVLGFVAGGTVNLPQMRAVAILNTHATLSVTLVIGSQPGFVIGPGQGVEFPMLPSSLDIGYTGMSLTAPAAATGTIAYVA